jgi:hypothetical protein
MNNLSSTLSPFRVSETGSNNWNIQTAIDSFIAEISEFPIIHRGSIVIREMGVLSDENQTAIDNIKSFKFLEENWDGEGALMIPSTTIDKVLKLVERIDKLDSTVYLASPGPNEEVLILLKKNNKELELIIYPNKEKFVKFEDNNYIQQGNIESENFNSLIEWIS